MRRRFQQNQEDCTFTVLALLPTATENILEALPVETITHEIQQHRAKRDQSSATSEAARSEYSPSVTEDAKSLSSLQTDSFIHTSQMGASTFEGAPEASKPTKTKAQLWNELKMNCTFNASRKTVANCDLAITRSFTLMYTLSLLTLLTRLQLNLLGRRNYLSSVVAMASPRNGPSISLENHDDRLGNSTGNEFETNRKFLTFSWWLLHRGWKDIMNKVEVAVKEVFGPINPREELTFERLSNLFVEVRKKIEGESEEARRFVLLASGVASLTLSRSQNWLPYLLPPRDQETFVLQESGVLGSRPQSSSSQSPVAPLQPTLFSQMPATGSDPLRRLLDETADLVESPTAAHILTLLLDALFSQLVDVSIRTQAFKVPDPTTEPSLRVQELLDTQLAEGVTDPSQATAKLANILAVVTRQAHSIGNGVPNVYVQAMEDVRDIEAFAAVVYSSNFEHVVNLGIEPERTTEPESRQRAEVESQGGSWGLFESVWGKVAGK